MHHRREAFNWKNQEGFSGNVLQGQSRNTEFYAHLNQNFKTKKKETFVSELNGFFTSWDIKNLDCVKKKYTLKDMKSGSLKASSSDHRDMHLGWL